MATSRSGEQIKIRKKKFKIGHKLKELHPISVTKPKSMEKIDSHHETFYSVKCCFVTALFTLTLVQTS